MRSTAHHDIRDLFEGDKEAEVDPRDRSNRPQSDEGEGAP
jgi:hypothetical protein